MNKRIVLCPIRDNGYNVLMAALITVVANIYHFSFFRNAAPSTVVANIFHLSFFRNKIIKQYEILTVHLLSIGLRLTL